MKHHHNNIYIADELLTSYQQTYPNMRFFALSNLKNAKSKEIWKKFLSFFDDKSKGKIKWWNRNYFYAGTIFISLLLIILCAANLNVWRESIIERYALEGGSVFGRLFYAFLIKFIYSNWSTVLYNILGFAVAAIYLERKTGTLNFVLLVFGLMFLCSTTDLVINFYSTFTSSFEWFALWGYVVIDFIFTVFQKDKRNKTNLILGVIVLVLLYFRACFYDKIGGGIGLGWYPHQIIDISSHFVMFMVGLIISLFVQVSLLVSKEQCKNK